MGLAMHMMPIRRHTANRLHGRREIVRVHGFRWGRISVFISHGLMVGFRREARGPRLTHIELLGCTERCRGSQHVLGAGVGWCDCGDSAGFHVTFGDTMWPRADRLIPAIVHHGSTVQPHYVYGWINIERCITTFKRAIWRRIRGHFLTRKRLIQEILVDPWLEQPRLLIMQENRHVERLRVGPRRCS